MAKWLERRKDPAKDRTSVDALRCAGFTHLENVNRDLSQEPWGSGLFCFRVKATYS